MFAQHPGIATRWADTYGTPKDLPEHVAQKRTVKRKRRRVKRP